MPYYVQIETIDQTRLCLATKVKIWCNFEVSKYQFVHKMKKNDAKFVISSEIGPRKAKILGGRPYVNMSQNILVHWY